jgi:hypothetical protein
MLDKYVALAAETFSHCEAVRALLKLVCLVAAALVLQVLILAYVAYRLSAR